MKSSREFVHEVTGESFDNTVEAIKARDLEMWKQGMTDAAACVRNNKRYAGEHWLPESVEEMRDSEITSHPSLRVTPKADCKTRTITKCSNHQL